jgi:hypothetical protein
VATFSSLLFQSNIKKSMILKHLQHDFMDMSYCAYRLYTGFQVLTAVVMERRETSVKAGGKQSSALHLRSRWFLLGLLFGPKYGGDLFLRNVD